MPDAIKIRKSSRVVLLDEDDRVLMLKIHDPAAARGLNPITADFWLLVGGGVEPGETYAEAARREVFEETGIGEVEIGPCVWILEKIVSDQVGDPLHVVSRFHVGRVRSTNAINFDRHEPLEASTIVGYEWFTVDQIVARQDTETFLPPGLGSLLADVLRAGTDIGDPIDLNARI